jgi:hypothetical protein
MKINFRTCTEAELWVYVAGGLADRGIESVLVGGAVVSIYTSGAYQSGDLDFIVGSLFSDPLPKAMAALGFQKKGRHYTHPECKHLFVEFPPGPLAIGEDTGIQPEEKRVEGKVLRILSPTDCIRDRLASFIHFKSRDALEQAVLVARSQPFNMSKIKEWCRLENASEAFAEFQRILAENKSKSKE